MSIARVVHRLEIPGWRPTLANELVYRPWWQARRRKQGDADVVARAAKAAGIPLVRWPRALEEDALRNGIHPSRLPNTPTPRRRRVVIEISNPSYDRPAQRPDRDAPLKSCLDALTCAGLIVDDNEVWCDWEIPIFEAGPKRTIILLEDL